MRENAKQPRKTRNRKENTLATVVQKYEKVIHEHANRSKSDK